MACRGCGKYGGVTRGGGLCLGCNKSSKRDARRPGKRQMKKRGHAARQRRKNRERQKRMVA